MAATKSPLEREELIEKIGEDFLETGISARQLANKYKISNVTASNYLNEFAKKHPKSGVIEKINGIKGNIDDIEIQKRVLASAELSLKGYTIENIASIFNVTYRVTYDDLSIRLKKIDAKIYNQVKEQLQKNKNQNLKNSKVR